MQSSLLRWPSALLLTAAIAFVLPACTEDKFESEYFEFAHESDSLQSKAEIQPVPDEVDDDMVYYCREGIYNERQIVLKGVDAQSMITHAHGVTEARTIWNADLPDTNYIAEIIVPEPGRERVMRRLQEAIDEELGLASSQRERKVPVLMLTALDGDSIRFPASDGRTVRYSWNDGTITGEGMTMNMLRHALEVTLGEPVISAISWEARFNVDLEWEARNVDDLRRSLEEHGLTLISSEEEIEMLVVDGPAKDNRRATPET